MKTKQDIIPQQIEQLQQYYSDQSNKYRTEIDEKFGIKSSLVHDHYSGKDCWARDATTPIAKEKRPSHNSPDIEVLNMQLRCLSRLRAIDYAIAEKSKRLTLAEKKILEEIREDLMVPLRQLSEHVESKITKATDSTTDEQKLIIIKELEESFNTSLLKALHAANLTQGCETKKDAEDLLNYYRNMSSLLDPARPMATKSYDEVAGVLQIEIQYPVTKKTDKQKAAMDKLAKIQPYPLAEERNSHNVRKIAFQEADSLFVDLMKEDDRLLAAQTRKTHEVGVKNAYIVKNELYKVDTKRFGAAKMDPSRFVPTDEQIKNANDKALWFARTGSPVYLGKGGTEESILDNTNENLEQIRLAMEERTRKTFKKGLHITSLLTDVPLEGQDKVLKYLRKATTESDKKQYMSNVPANLIGTVYSPSIHNELVIINSNDQGGIGQRATRMEMAVAVTQAAHNQEFISVIQCNSGQDRTGVAAELTTQTWMKHEYERMGWTDTNIETVRAGAGNAAEMASHLITGSRGLKKESRAHNFFGNKRVFTQSTERALHLNSAATNKESRIRGNVDFLNTPSTAAVNEFNALSEQLTSNYNILVGKQDDPLFSEYYKSTKTVLNNIKTVLEQKGALLSADIYSVNASKIDSKTLSDLTNIVRHCNIILDNHLGDKEINIAQVKESITRLASLSKVVSGRESKASKNLGKALMAFACLTLVAIGLLAAIPTGGTSLLAVVVGAVGLNMNAVAATATVALVAGIEGYRSKIHGEERGLAQAVTLFKDSYKSINLTGDKDDDTPQPK